jgi:ATP-binding cassette, subfamily A (ABC1), member 3
MGRDVQNEMAQIRNFLGVCPQHDILFDDLTVKEHLLLFAAFKGMKSSDIPQAVEKMISDLDFIDKTNYKSKNLSGGQKRKLSLGIAFIGNSKFILLDEPTSVLN